MSSIGLPNKTPIKLVTGVRNVPLVEVDDTSQIGVDRWRQADLVNAAESGLTVSVSVAEHPANTSWDTAFWWHEVALVLEGEMVVEDKGAGATYRGGEGDMFYFDQGLQARIGGAFKAYLVRTPIPWRLARTSGGVRAVDLLRADDEVILAGSPPHEVREDVVAEMKGREFPDRGLMKFVKGATRRPLGKVDSLGVSLDENWWHAPLLEGVETNLLLSVSLASHSSRTMNFGHLHRWHQIILFLEGEMITEVLDTGEVYRARKGDFLYFAPGLKHRVGGDFKVFVFHTPVRWRYARAGEGYMATNSILETEGEALQPGSPPSELA